MPSPHDPTPPENATPGGDRARTSPSPGEAAAGSARTAPSGQRSTPAVLVTGASGYVGGRLVPALLQAGAAVTCLARTPAKLDDAPWRSRVRVVAGGVGGDLSEALASIDVAVYLVHSIGQGRDWAAREQTDAEHFGRAAAAAGVARIVYLGGLGHDDAELSAHLRSRHAVGVALGAAGVPVVELRAGMIIGSGSASFEMLRYLVEVLPVMVTPAWIATRTQPVAISDVVRILVHTVVDPALAPGVYEVGGPDVVTYAGLMEMYREVAGLSRRYVLRIPLLTPGLSAHWVGLVTPVPASLARELVESLVNEVVVSDRGATSPLPPAGVGVREAISRSLAATRRGEVPTSFVDAALGEFAPTSTDPAWSGGTVLTDVRSARSSCEPERVFEVLAAIGGDRGWYGGQFLWQVRGIMDQLVGGPGLRRGRRNPTSLGVGDPVDFWRVEVVAPARRLRLHAEMLLPGDAWLTWDLDALPTGGTRITQTAEYRPRGLVGRLYWLGVAPFHRFVFPNLLAGIVADAEAGDPVPTGADAGS